MVRLLAVAVLFAAAVSATAADKPTAKVEDTPPPKELADPVRNLLDAKAMTALDDKGKVICTVWPRKALESKATAEQATAGLKYSNLDETTVVGAVQFPDVFVDYRKQKIKPGVYTLRLGLQPMDGDHQGTAPFNDFCLLVSAEVDKKPDTCEPKELHEMSAKASGRKHPGVMMLFPNKKPGDAPVVESKPPDNWVLSFKVQTTAAGQKVELGFSLVVVGHTTAE
jgi:hypothetical protein